MTIWVCEVCYLAKCKFDDGCLGNIPSYIPSEKCPMMNADIARWKPTKLVANYAQGTGDGDLP